MLGFSLSFSVVSMPSHRKASPSSWVFVLQTEPLTSAWRHYSDQIHTQRADTGQICCPATHYKADYLCAMPVHLSIIIAKELKCMFQREFRKLLLKLLYVKHDKYCAYEMI